MSLIQEVTDRLRSSRDSLPIADVTGASGRLRIAQGLFAWVRNESSRPDAVPGISLAASRLDHAAAALRVAQDAIDDYCQALGMTVDGRPTEIPPPVPAQRTTQADTQLGDWWSERLASLTGFNAGHAGSGGGRRETAGSSSDLLVVCVAAALDSDARRIHRALTAAGPAVGLGLAAVAPPLLRHLAGELVGHPPRLEDLARVRRAALPILAEVLPSLAGDAAEEIIARICHAQPERQETQPAHPVDIAVASALLVAGLLRANKLTADNLSKVVDRPREAADEAQQRAQERAGSHRAALRITDNARRRSAVDQLRPAAQ
ncbi:MAG TPA: hypothetical protein VFC19_03715 [Candidatus Limnocylindrales bacterium]|nr:hypothetical protein [Candidatus Limnocylindrales bacterium]